MGTNQISPMRGVPETIQNAVTNGNGVALAIPPSFNNHTLTITGSAGVASGAVRPEASDDILFAGTWAPVGGGPVTVVASSKQVVNFVGTFAAIRCGVSTPVVGGTVTVTYEGKP